MLKPRHLLLIDRLLQIPYSILSYLFWHMRKHSVLQPRQENRVVVFKFMGMGSIIRMYSIWEKSRVDVDKVVLCTFRQNKEICELLGFTKVIYLRTDGFIHFLTDACRAIWEIRKLQPEYLLDLERCSAAVGMFRICCAWLATCKTLALDTKPKDRENRNDIIWSLKKRTFGTAIEQMAAFLPKEQVPEKQIDAYQDTIADEHKILINVNASAYLPQRKYPPGHFVQLMQALYAGNSRYTFYLTGSRDEHLYVQEIVDKLQKEGISAYNAAGGWNLQQLVRQLSTCRLFITNDSGPMHLAVHMQIPTVAIWGPTHYRYFGYENNARTRHISLQPSCSPCFTDPLSKAGIACQGKILCMQELNPQWIVTHIQYWLLPHTLAGRRYLLPKGLLQSEPKPHMQLTQ